MLVLRPYVDNFDFLPFYQFPQKVMPHVTAPVATAAARAKATGHVSMSTRPDPERSGAVEIAARRRPRLRVVLNLRELTHSQKPRLWSLPARLGPVTVHRTRWGVGSSMLVRVE